MRGQQERRGSLFSYVSIKERIPATHRLRGIRKLTDQALDRLNRTFCKLYDRSPPLILSVSSARWPASVRNSPSTLQRVTIKPSRAVTDRWTGSSSQVLRSAECLVIGQMMSNSWPVAVGNAAQRCPGVLLSARGGSWNCALIRSSSVD